MQTRHRPYFAVTIFGRRSYLTSFNPPNHRSPRGSCWNRMKLTRLVDKLTISFAKFHLRNALIVVEERNSKLLVESVRKRIETGYWRIADVSRTFDYFSDIAHVPCVVLICARFEHFIEICIALWLASLSAVWPRHTCAREGQVSRKQKGPGADWQSITSGQSSRDYLHHQTRNRSHINHATTSAARLTNERGVKPPYEIEGWPRCLACCTYVYAPLSRFTVPLPFDPEPAWLLLTFDLLTRDGETVLGARSRGKGWEPRNRRFHACIDEASAPDATFPCTGSTPNFRQA